MILDKLKITITASKSKIQFTTDNIGKGTFWNRFITIEGEEAFHIGNICETCSYFFERLAGANKSVNPEEVVNSLHNGLSNLDDAVVKNLEKLFPDGKYLILLQQIVPNLISPSQQGDYFCEEQIELWGIDGFWGLPHFPKTEYYRLLTKTIKETVGLFEFIIPIFPHSWLDKEQIQEYETLLSENVLPTAVSVSTLDDKGPAHWIGDKHITSHWCLSHYLIDGHHKVYSAAKNNKALTLISFIAIEKGVSTEEQVDELIKILE
jgi:hypothetical protein